MNRRDFLLSLTALFGLKFIFQNEITRLADNIWLVKFMKFDCLNSNNRVYPLKLKENILNNFKEVHGEFPTSTSSIINWNNVSHKINKLHIKHQYLLAEIEILLTPKGKKLHNILVNNVNLVKFRSRGIGGINGNIIRDSYKLITVDAMEAKDASTWVD